MSKVHGAQRCYRLRTSPCNRTPNPSSIVGVRNPTSHLIDHQRFMEVLPWWRMRFSYRNATILVCFLNVVAATLLLRGFFSVPDRRIASAKEPNLAQMRYIMESEEIRRSMEPMDLIKRIKEIEEEAYSEPDMETKQVPKQTAAVDLSKRLSDLRAMNDANSLKALLEWRKRKMDRARQREIDRNAGAGGAAAAAQT